MAPFDGFCTSFCLRSIVTVMLSCIVCEIQRVGRKSLNFYTTPVFSALQGVDLIGVSRRCLILIKLEWLGYRVVKKLWRYVKPFRYNIGTWQTDRQTELLYQYCTSSCWPAIKINMYVHNIITKFLRLSKKKYVNILQKFHAYGTPCSMNVTFGNFVHDV